MDLIQSKSSEVITYNSKNTVTVVLYIIHITVNVLRDIQDDS